MQVLGEVGGELTAAGQEVVIGGQVGGDVSVTAGRIRILDTARIEGRLAYRSAEEPDIAEGAEIAGDIERLALSETGPDTRGVIGTKLGAAVLTANSRDAFRRPICDEPPAMG